MNSLLHVALFLTSTVQEAMNPTNLENICSHDSECEVHITLSQDELQSVTQFCTHVKFLTFLEINTLYSNYRLGGNQQETMAAEPL